MKHFTLCGTAFVLLLSSWAYAVSVDRNITAEHVKLNPNEFTVSVVEGPDGLVAFSVVYTCPEPRYVVAHLVVKDSLRTYAESHTPSFTKNHSNTFHFSIPREMVATSTFSLGVSGFVISGGEAVPRPGTIENKLQLVDFVPEALRSN